MQCPNDGPAEELEEKGGRGPPPFVTGLGSPGRGVSLGKYAMPQQVGEPQDPDPSVGPTFVAHNWFYRTTCTNRPHFAAFSLTRS